MNVFITGVSSALGHKVAQLCKERGAKIFGSVRSSRLPFYSKFVDSLVALDLEDPESFVNINAPVDVFIHVAAQSYGDPSDLMLTTGLGTLHLLERAKILGVPSFLHISAVSVYGRSPSGHVGGDSQIRHSSPYGVAKWAAECYLSDPQNGINCISVRCPAILERDYSPHLLGRIRNQMKGGAPIKLANPKFLFNNFVTLDTLARFLVDLAIDMPEGYHAFPVGSTLPLAFSEVVELLATEFRFRGVIDWEHSESPPFSIDCSTAEEHGFVPLSVVEGLNWWFRCLRD